MGGPPQLTLGRGGIWGWLTPAQGGHLTLLSRRTTCEMLSQLCAPSAVPPVSAGHRSQG